MDAATEANRPCEERVKVRLQRQGVSETLHGTLPNGNHISIFYHAGLKQWTREIEHTRKDGQTFGKTDTIGICNLSQALQATERDLGVKFEPVIEAYMYYSEWMRGQYPHIATDAYITCATYEPGSETIRHEPSNICLVYFEHPPLEIGWNKTAYLYDDAGNLPYREQIKNAITHYNSNVAAHGKGRDRVLWLTWLLGECIKDKCPDQAPILTHSLERA